MRILLAVLFLAAFAWAGDREEMEAEIRAAKERLHAVLADAEELERAGKGEDAARAREEAERIERGIHEMARAIEEREQRRPEAREPLREALHGLEIAIEGLRRAGYEESVRDLEVMADRLRAQMKARERRKAAGPLPRGWDAEFERRNMDTLRLAMKALAEAEKRDAVDLVERAIHARELALSGRRDEEAIRIIEKSPGDEQLGKLLLVAADLWAGFKQPDKAERCEELGKFLLGRAGKRGREMPEHAEAMERIERLEQRLERMEQMLHEVLSRMEKEPERR